MNNQDIMNILLIEDDAGLVELITVSLEELGFSVMSAISGTEALVLIEKQTPDLILLDYSLPDINGKELIETLNKQQIPIPPFIITTGQGDERIAVDMMMLGAMDYVIKDILFLDKLPNVITRVIKEIETDTNLKQAEEALVKNEIRFRAFMNASNDATFIKDEHFRYLFANEQTAHLFNTTVAEIIGKTDTELAKLIDIIPCQSSDKRTLESNEPFTIEEQIGKRIFEVTKLPLQLPNNKKGIGGIMKDITERVDTEVALRESEERFKSLMQQSPFVVELYDLNGLQISVNKAYEELWGFPAETTVNKFNILESKEVEDTGLMEYVKRAYAGDSVIVPEFLFNPIGNTEAKGRGRVRWLSTRIYPLKELSGKIINIVIVHQDITERKLAEKELKHSENLYRTLSYNIPGMTYRANSDWSLKTILNSVDLCGYSDEAFMTQKVNWLDIIHPADKEKTLHETSKFLKEPTHIIQSYRIISKSANILWVEDHKTSLFNSDGEFLGVDGIVFNITDRMQVAQDLGESEERFELAMKASKDGLFDWNLVSNEIYYSPGWKAMLGYKDTELANDFSVWEKLTKPEDAEKSWKIQQEVINKKRDRFELEFQMKHKEGHWVDILSRAEVIFDDKGKAIKMVGTHVDISEQKQEENILSVELKLFEYAINHSEEELLQKFLDEAEKLTDSKIGFYHYIEDDQESISLQAWSTNTLNNMCKGSGEASRHYPISEAGVWVDCIEVRKPVVHNDYSSLAHKKGLPEGHAPIIRQLVVPVIRGNQIKAVLGVGNKESDYNENDVKRIQRLADVAWETVVRKQAEEKTHAAEKNLQNTFDLSPSIIAKANMTEGRFIQVNKAITKILGYSIDEFTSRPYMEFVHPDDRQNTIDIATEQLKGNEVTFFENRYLCEDGTYKWMAWHGTKPDQNGIVTTIGSDINERKQAELKLTQSTLLLEASQSIAKLGGWELDIATNNLFWTAETYRIHETSPDKFNPTVDAGVGYFLPESRRLISNALDAAIKEGKGYDLELETLTTKGNRIDIRTTCEVTLLDGKPIKLTGIFQDITERKQAEKALKESEKNLKNTFDLSPSIIAKVDFKTGCFVEVNQAVTRILGYTVEEFTSKPFMEFLHPDDKDRTDEGVKKNKEKGVTAFENRYLCKDGSYKWMAWHGTKPDKNGIVTTIGSDINERKIVEQEIAKTKQFYENITEGVQDGIWVTDKNDVIFYVNSAMEKIAGVPKEKIQGKNILNDFPEATTGELIKYYKQAKKEKIPVWYIIKVKTPSQRDSWQNGWLIPQFQNKVFTGVICTIRDVTERKLAEGSVRKLSTAVEQNPSTIVITDIDGKLEYVNPKFTELTGYSSAEAIGQESNILKSGEQNSVFYTDLWKTVKSGKVWRGQFRNKKKNGELFWEAASISAILNESGDVINFIKIGEDITQQKNIEEELKIALEKALESDRLKSAFLANMSHEIRTPMNGILGFINLINEPDLSKSEIEQYAAIINRSGARLLNTINDIIDISKIEAGEIVVIKTEISIAKEMEELYSFFLPEAKKKGLALISEPAISNEQLTINTDTHKLNGILTNLIKNAIKYTEKGNITIGYFIREGFVEFYVKDTGVGIPKDRIRAIFNRFEQADTGDTRVFEGAGLGLAIAKAYIEMMGGDISVISEKGKGSTFTFTIPYHTKGKKEMKQVPENIDAKTLSLKDLNLLIVEDDDISADFLETILKDDFRKITYAVNGIEAIERCRTHPEINLVLMDINLPKMNGYQAVKEIRKFNKDIVIIAQTAYALAGDKAKAIEAGCNDYISKPINKTLLLEMIHKLLDA